MTFAAKIISGAIALTTLSLAAPAFAAGSSDSTPPKPTATSKECLNGQVWDKDTQKCVEPSQTNFSDDALYNAARELAYQNRLKDAQHVLAAMADQQDDRALTYWGFTHRKLGNVDLGMAFYEQALTQNPDNILARSYMGQAHVLAGDIDLAKAQLSEITTRGGVGSWAEASLRKAIETGAIYNH